MTNELFDSGEELAPETFIDNEDETDKSSIKERIEEYSDTRMTAGHINETHKRVTLLLDIDTVNKLQNLVNLMEASNGLESSFTEGKTVKQARNDRLLAKGFKSKIVNYALNTVLDQWEQESENKVIPEVEKVRYKDDESGTYNRSFMFKENGLLYLITQNNRGLEVEFRTSDDDNETGETLKEDFEARVRKANS